MICNRLSEAATAAAVGAAAGAGVRAAAVVLGLSGTADGAVEVYIARGGDIHTAGAYIVRSAVLCFNALELFFEDTHDQQSDDEADRDRDQKAKELYIGSNDLAEIDDSRVQEVIVAF